MKFIPTYNLQIMDLLFLVLVLAFFLLVTMIKVRHQRIRLDALEKHLNLSAPKNF